MTPPIALLPYLTTQGSLTALLEKKAKQPLRVKILKEGFEVIDFQHKKLLSLPVHRPELAWVREVLLFGDDERAWVQAKSIFPLKALIGEAKRLRHLKGVPIGYVMFKKNKTLPHIRHVFEKQGNFGRASVYDWHGRKILIEEIFLDIFVAKLSNDEG